MPKPPGRKPGRGKPGKPTRPKEKRTEPKPKTLTLLLTMGVTVEDLYGNEPLIRSIVTAEDLAEAGTVDLRQALTIIIQQDPRLNEGLRMRQQAHTIGQWIYAAVIVAMFVIGLVLVRSRSTVLHDLWRGIFSAP